MNKSALTFFCIPIIIYSLLNCAQIYSRSAGSDFFLVWAVNSFNSKSDSGKTGNIFSMEYKEKLSEEMQKIGRNTKDQDLIKAVNARPDMNLCGTPFFYSIFMPLSKMSFTHARAFFFAMEVLSLFAGFLILSRLMKVSRLFAILFISNTFILYYPIEMSLSLGNVNEILVFFSILFFCIQKYSNFSYSKILEGFCIGLLCFFKPFFIYSILILLVFYWIQNKKSAGFYFLGLSFSLIAVLCCTLTFFDLFSSWQGWFSYLNTLNIAYWADSVIYGNFSLRAVLFQMTGNDSILFQIFCGMTAFFLPFGVKRYVRNDSQDLEFYFFWIGYVLFLLGSPLVWYHYFSLLIVPFFCTLAELNIQTGKRGLIFSLILGIVWVVLGMPYSYENCWALSVFTKTLLFYGSLLTLVFLWGILLFRRMALPARTA